MAAKQAAKKWRESASLMILSRDKLMKPKTSGADYKILLFNRSEKASSFAKSAVFPGGVREAVDESRLWLEHFKKFGIQDNKLKELTVVHGPRPGIFGKPTQDCLAKELSLRITAIRETFEEVGIFLCKDRKALVNSNGFGSFQEDFDRQHWQQVVHDDPSQFLKLCQELDVLPDLWSLQEWSAWLTPAIFKSRFEVVFYMVPLLQTPNLVLEKTEVVDYAWKSPLDYLKAFANKELLLPPPQLYELSRLLNFSELEELKRFASERSSKGSNLILPVFYKCTNGKVSLYPGDDKYPNDPHDVPTLRETNCSIEEFRSGAKNIHRSEFSGPHDARLWRTFDTEDGQVAPLNFQDVQSKL